MTTTLCKQTHWFTSSGCENVHRVSSPSQHQFVYHRTFHQTWNQTMHIIHHTVCPYACIHTSKTGPTCTLLFILRGSSEPSPAQGTRYISKVHVHNISISFCSSFTNLQSFDQNSIKPWTETSGSLTSEVKRKEKKHNFALLVRDGYLFMK